MEGVGGANEGKKRRLPSWMMGTAVANNLTSQENRDDSVGGSKPGEVGLCSKVSVPKVKTGSRKAVKKNLLEDEETCVTEKVFVRKRKTRSRKIVNESLDEDDEIHDSEEVNVTNMKRSKRGHNGTLCEDEEANSDNSRVLVKCARGKRNQKSNSEVEESGVNNIGSETLDRISAPQKKGRVKKSRPKDVSSSCTDSGTELVMEDLIIIAEEERYVKAESLTEQRRQEAGASGPEVKLPAADPSSDEPASSSFDGAGIKGLSAATEVKSNLPFSSDQVHNGSTFNNISSTGDAAQDMLNLLLGPLLIKPVEESTTTLTHDDMQFVRTVQHQSQNHIVEESVQPVRKKTSLKDKVAMFLD